jgi:hypothetical protein
MLEGTDIGDDDPVPLAQAAKVFLHGQLTKSSLRTEAAKGNLEILRIANKDFVTRNGIRNMLERCKVPAKTPRLEQSFHPTVTPQEALRAMLRERKEHARDRPSRRGS